MHFHCGPRGRLHIPDLAGFAKLHTHEFPLLGNEKIPHDNITRYYLPVKGLFPESFRSNYGCVLLTEIWHLPHLLFRGQHTPWEDILQA